MGDSDRPDCVLIGPHICSMTDPRLPDCSVLTKAEKVIGREETALDRLHQSSRQARPTSMDRPPAAGRRRSGRAKVPFLPQTSRLPSSLGSSLANLQPPRGALGRSSRPHLRTWRQAPELAAWPHLLSLEPRLPLKFVLHFCPKLEVRANGWHSRFSTRQSSGILCALAWPRLHAAIARPVRSSSRHFQVARTRNSANALQMHSTVLQCLVSRPPPSCSSNDTHQRHRRRRCNMDLVACWVRCSLRASHHTSASVSQRNRRSGWSAAPDATELPPHPRMGPAQRGAAGRTVRYPAPKQAARRRPR